MFSKKKKYVSQISNKSFKQLAKNNVKKSMKDYMIYFITLSFGAALLYSFNSIDSILSNMMGNGLLDAYVYMSRGILGAFSIIICLIFGFLITYSNNFIMKKRKREFGIYITLGMDKRDINKLMFKETVIIGLISLGFGLIFGIFASQGLSIIAFKMINLDSSMFRFSISISALIKTIALFVFVLFLVNKFNKRNIKKYKLIDLINSNKKNENFATTDNGIKNFITFILSIILIVGSYALIKSLFEPNITIISICIVLISFGTYLFFISISDFILKQIRKCKKVYYSNLTMFTISQISTRIKTMSSSITIICLVIFSALIIIPFGMSFADYFKRDVDRLTPFDATVVKYNYRNKDEDTFYENGIYSNDKSLLNKKYVSLKDDFLKGNFPYSNLISNSNEVKVYELKDVTLSKLSKNINNKDDYRVAIISVEDYNNIRKQQGLDNISLKNNEFALNGNTPENKKIIEELINDSRGSSLNINSHILNFSNIYSDLAYYNSNVASSQMTVIVSDNILNNLYPIRTYLNVSYIQSNNEYDNNFSEALYNFRDHNNYDLRFESKLVIDGEKIAVNLVSSFISIYIGVILIISAGALLALGQISELAVNKQRFNILRKLGVNKKHMKKAMFVQVLILFMMPLVLALFHSIFVSNILYEVILELSTAGLFKNILISSIIVIVIYGSYLFASYYESLNIIKD